MNLIKQLLIVVSIIVAFFFIKNFYDKQQLNNFYKKYKVVNVDESINSRIKRFDSPDVGRKNNLSSSFELNNGQKITLVVKKDKSVTYSLKEILSLGDSIYKQKNSTIIKVIKKQNYNSLNKEYIFHLNFSNERYYHYVR